MMLPTFRILELLGIIWLRENFKTLPHEKPQLETADEAQ